MTGAVVYNGSSGFTDASQQKDTTKVQTGKDTIDIIRSVLIIKGNSYLENAVAKILSDSLLNRGFQVKYGDVAHADRESAGKFTTTMIFNAIKKDQNIDPIVQRYIDSKNGGSSNILIFTVYGATNNSTSKEADAITAATKSLNPVVIAVRIMSTFNSIDKSK